MAGYIIARIKVHDWEQYRKYTAETPRIIADHGGRFLARGGETVTLEGEEEDGRTVILEFPSLDAAVGFYRSEAYTEVKALRLPAAEARFVAIEGV